jgi:hypothetical protein
MKLEEIEDNLPNGFHDSHIKTIHIDYEKRLIRMLLDIWVGNPTSGIESVRETYKSGELFIKNFYYFVIEPPDPRYEYSKPSTLWIDARPLKTNPTNVEVKLPSNIPENAFIYRVFVNNWNSFIYFAATDAALELDKE